MALKSDIKAANDNRPVDLHERRVIDPNMDMSPAVLDLRNPQQPLSEEDHNFFFEFLPATAAHMPMIQVDEVRDAVVGFFKEVWAFVRRHPRYFIAGFLSLIALALFGLSAATHRTVIRTNNETPAAAAATASQPTAATSATTTAAPAAPAPAPTVTKPKTIQKTNPPVSVSAPTTAQSAASQPAAPAPAPAPVADPPCQVDLLGVCIPTVLPNASAPLDPVADPLPDTIAPE